ncbi:pre-rRNA-processing protein-like protein ESF1 [Calycina marina]|uniref:Pre-rRNA-processing protein-like protein ESF1 n=1 Tax=Calycina marina TaxID=1763456 RepID=A0A9P7Z4L4_9HELO|nr:pre-rRNA-processing protein-like protein ESF1 [Calycina marina]
MVKQKTAKGSASTTSVSGSSDARFSNFTTDPRFRLPSKKHSRTTIDKRFSRMLEDEDFTNTAKVDRYGRKLSSGVKKKVLERLYVPDEEGEAGIEVEDDDVIQRELEKLETAGLEVNTSSEESESESEEDEEDGGVEIEEPEFPDMAAGQQGVEMGDVSKRIAVVNLDWDQIRAVDLLAVFQSFVPSGGSIKNISIYQSEFGKERMEREELEGPPKEIFTKQESEYVDSGFDSDEDEDSDEEDDEKIKKDLIKEDDGADFDGTALRKYQLERLRYYYAVIVCSDKDTAEKIYENTDGKEYLSSANFFDLRFIPDETEFDEKPRDQCDEVPSDYKPIEFTTDALQHSKVKLTWDQDPEEGARKDAIQRAFTGSRADIGENDLKAYLGSDSEDDDVEEAPENTEDAPPLSKKEMARQKLRADLGLPDEPIKATKKKVGPVGDMEITFSSGLSTTEKGSVFANKPIIEETTAEAYVRKERERKARRKERAKAVREGRDPDAPAVPVEEAEPENDDLGFNDPFFAADTSVKEKASKALKRDERKKKHAEKEAGRIEKESKRAELELLMQDDGAEEGANIDHFDINEIARVEKKKKRAKKGKGEVLSKRGGMQESFELDVADPRFTKVFESHEFAIDTSNPRFKKTEGMSKLLQEGRKRRGGESDGEVDVQRTKKKKTSK